MKRKALMFITVVAASFLATSLQAGPGGKGGGKGCQTCGFNNGTKLDGLAVLPGTSVRSVKLPSGVTVKLR